MKRSIWFFFAVLLCVATPAQSADDARLWVQTGVRFKPKKKINIELTQHLRMRYNMSSLASLNTDIETSWRAEKWLRIGGGYRLNGDGNKDGQLRAFHRFHAFARVAEKFGPIRLSYRLQYQLKLEPEDSELTVYNTLRNKAGMEVDTDTDFSPGLSVELFKRFGANDPFGLERFRLTAGIEYKPNKRHVFEMFYRLQLPLDGSDDATQHIVGLGYQLRVPRKKKAKKEDKS